MKDETQQDNQQEEFIDTNTRRKNYSQRHRSKVFDEVES